MTTNTPGEKDKDKAGTLNANTDLHGEIKESPSPDKQEDQDHGKEQHESIKNSK